MSDISLSSILSDGMVIQRGSKTKIYGKAQKNKNIIVEFLNEIYETYSDKNGEWQIKLHDLQPGGPYEMVIKEDKELIRIKDILIGDVWICSGQSNMELPIERVKELYANQILGYSNSNIRQFFASQNYSFEGPQNELEYGVWKSINPETILDFTAVGYFFAKELYDRYKVPIGLVSTAVGGTPIEAWMSKESLKSFHRFDELISSCEDNQYVINKQKEDDARINDWYKEMNLKDEGLGKWNSEYLDDSNWNQFVIPGMWRDTPLDKVDGAVWFRKEIYLPKIISNYEAKLYLGTIIDADEVYINGELVGKTEYRYPPRNYLVNNGILKRRKKCYSGKSYK